MKKNLLSVAILIPGIAVSSCTDKDNLASSEPKMDNTIGAKDASIEEDALKIYEALNSSFVSTRNGNKIYPENYGGNYLDKNGDFVVLIVEGQETKGLDYVPKGAVIKTCKYSYNELLNILEILKSYKLTDNREIYNNFLVFYIDDKLNRVIVELTDTSSSAKQAFRENVSNSDAIIFVKASTKTEFPVTPFNNSNSEEIEYIPSCAIETRAASHPFLAGAPFGNVSIGYRAKKDNKIGLVTCGHSKSLGMTFKVDGKEIGKITQVSDLDFMPFERMF